VASPRRCVVHRCTRHRSIGPGTSHLNRTTNKPIDYATFETRALNPRCRSGVRIQPIPHSCSTQEEDTPEDHRFLSQRPKQPLGQRRQSQSPAGNLDKFLPGDCFPPFTDRMVAISRETREPLLTIQSTRRSRPFPRFEYSCASNNATSDNQTQGHRAHSHSTGVALLAVQSRRTGANLRSRAEHVCRTAATKPNSDQHEICAPTRQQHSVGLGIR